MARAKGKPTLSIEQKTRIVLSVLAGEMSMSEAARRHGVAQPRCSCGSGRRAPSWLIRSLRRPRGDKTPSGDASLPAQLVGITNGRSAGRLWHVWWAASHASTVYPTSTSATSPYDHANQECALLGTGQYFPFDVSRITAV